MPVAELKTYDAVRNAVPTTVVVHCSDPRFQPAFRQFIADELHLKDGEYVPMIIRGGAGGFMHPERLPKDFTFLTQRVASLKERFGSIRRIVLINHQDCGFYHALTSRVVGARQPSEQMVHDLGRAGGIFARLLSHLGLAVEVYYAKFADPAQTQITFEKVV
jgi:hypothetical protein